MSRPVSNQRRRLQFEPLERRNLLAVMIGTREFPTIQDAIDNAVAGNQILVDDGVYAESLDLSRMGSALGRGPANLVIRGVESVDGAVIRPASGTAVRNSAAFSANLNLSQLVFESPSSSPDSHGVVLDGLTGDIELHALVFRDIDRSALLVNDVAGSFMLQSSLFLETGNGDGDAATAISLAGMQGTVILDGNTLAGVAGTAIAIEQGGDTEAAAAITGNTVIGDANFLSTTRNGVLVRGFGNALLDLTLDDNTLDNLSGRAIDVSAGEQSSLQTRWTRNNSSQAAGATAFVLGVNNNAAAALTATDNNILDAAGDGMQLVVSDSARVAALLRNNLFLVIGDDAADRGLVVSSAAGSAGEITLLADNNTFDTISGDGLVVSLDGATRGSVTLKNNFSTGVNSLGGTAATLIENAAGSTSQIRATIHDNQVLGSAEAAIQLTQQSGGIALAAAAGRTAEEQLTASNSGAPIVVVGTITSLDENALDGEQLLLLGEAAWIDENGDGLRQSTEAPLPFATLELTGTETDGGATVQRTTMTDADGRYLFGALSRGSYTVSYAQPLGLKVAPVDQGDDDAIDNDFSPTSGTALVDLTADNLTVDLGVLRTWQNPRNRLDVNNDGLVTSNDALRLINDINNNNRQMPLPLPTSEVGPPPFLDPNKDGFVTPNDVLQVINFLNAQVASGEGEGTTVAMAARGEEAASRGAGAQANSASVIAALLEGRLVTQRERGEHDGANRDAAEPDDDEQGLHLASVSRAVDLVDHAFLEPDAVWMFF